MFGNPELDGFEYKDVTYSYMLDHEDDNCKTSHVAILTNGVDVHFDWSPYSNPTKEDFMLWVDLGMPERVSGSPLNRKDLEYIRGAGLSTWNFDLASRDSDWSRKGVRMTIGSERLLREEVAKIWPSCDIVNLSKE